MSEHIPAFERCLDRSLPREQQPRAEWMRADRDRIGALEAETARLREALGEAIDVLSGVRHNPPHDRPTPKELDEVMPRLRAAL